MIEAVECLIIFTRYPVPGKTKTRLIPALGAEGAAKFHAGMIEHTVNQARQLRISDGIAIEIHYDDTGVDRAVGDWLGADLRYHIQETGNLGERMARSMEHAFRSGSKGAIVIGTDCPDLTTDLIRLGFAQLHAHDLVIGSAIDGGYYLIGLRRFIPELFTGISWSTDRVLSQTVAIADNMGLSIAYLPTLSDIDRPSDLDLIKH